MKKGRSGQQELHATKAHLSQQVRNVHEGLNCCYPTAITVIQHSLEHWTLLIYIKHYKQIGMDRTMTFEGKYYSFNSLSTHFRISMLVSLISKYSVL